MGEEDNLLSFEKKKKKRRDTRGEKGAKEVAYRETKKGKRFPGKRGGRKKHEEEGTSDRSLPKESFEGEGEKKGRSIQFPGGKGRGPLKRGGGKEKKDE